MITVAGGVYRELCARPRWDEWFGSAGRAATSIARLRGSARLVTYLDDPGDDVTRTRAELEGFEVSSEHVGDVASFRYLHALKSPHIQRSASSFPTLKVHDESVLCYGVIEGNIEVDAGTVVYDPQNVDRLQPFRANGSRADRLAIVCNRHEASLLLGEPATDPVAMAGRLADKEKAEVVVLKLGPMGAIVCDRGHTTTVPAFRTSRVWKIGSGDQFAANFAHAWMSEGSSPNEAALLASRATAYYCQFGGFPTPEELAVFAPLPIDVSMAFKAGYVPTVYLAGPFFTLAQLWVVEEARKCLHDMGLKVFSPYHDVGLGTADEVVAKDLQGIDCCDVMLAIGDGFDSGTVFEVGYARAKGKPVVVYVENESAEGIKMMDGSACVLANDFVTAIYLTAWSAVGA
jgi:nucleoside 2-deoxyribosyltransferase